VQKLAAFAATVVGGIMIVAGVVTWIVVSNTLSEQKIVVSDDASCLAGDEVDGPFSAYCQADIINQHTLDATGGKTYAELGQEDPLRETAMTSAFLQSSLFTSVVAFGVAAMAFVLGLMQLLIGLALRGRETAPGVRTGSAASVAGR
jgi:hypothetical protein